MGWSIECLVDCGEGAYATNIVNLLDEHRDSKGWFQCKCGERGYIRKSYELQEPGETWTPFLKGAVRCKTSENETYKPFVFLVGYEVNDTVDDIWFSYYKDLRHKGGRLKLGYGPGGPPVLNKISVLELVSELVRRECLRLDDVRKQWQRLE